ncbi:MAG: EutN/CcmL family microcompartment protein, partial [Rhodopirellula bahusiensis]
MKIARVIGTVTLSRMHPSMQGYKLRCVEVVESADQ